MMTPQDLRTCKLIHTSLASKDNRSINFVFMEPVDTILHPTYSSIVKRPMDLQTLSRNLDRGVYATKGEFYADVQLMFDNEVLFNKGAESEWIVQLATRMEHMFIQLKKKYDSGVNNDGDGGSASMKKKSAVANIGGGGEAAAASSAIRGDSVSTSGSGASTNITMKPAAVSIGGDPTKGKAVQHQRLSQHTTATAGASSAILPQGVEPGSQIMTDPEKKEKERSLMFTRVLMKYLEQRDTEMHAKAKSVIKECYEKNKAGDPEYQCLTTSMKAHLQATVGEVYWKKAQDYLDHFLRQKEVREGQSATSLASQASSASGSIPSQQGNALSVAAKKANDAKQSTKSSIKGKSLHPTASKRDLLFEPKPVDDFPLGWVSRRVERMTTVPGKPTADVYYFSPQMGYKFRSKLDVQRFLDCLAGVPDGEEVAIVKFRQMKKDDKPQQKRGSSDVGNSISTATSDNKHTKATNTQNGGGQAKLHVHIVTPNKNKAKKQKTGHTGFLLSSSNNVSIMAQSTSKQSNSSSAQASSGQPNTSSAAPSLTSQQSFLYDSKLAAYLQSQEERLAKEDQEMLSATLGRAYKFAEGVISACQRLLRLHGNVGIGPVAMDDMVNMAESLLICRETFESTNKDTSIDLGFHFTHAAAMEHIQRDGLMTMSDRKSNPKLNPDEARQKHGGVFGDGVYTGDIPASIKRYGDVGIVLARLRGNMRRIKGSEVEIAGTLEKLRISKINTPTGQHAITQGYDTIIGNKSTGIRQHPHLDEIILLRSAQCIPLLRFPSSLIIDMTIPSTLQPWLDAMQEVINDFFNESPKQLEIPGKRKSTPVAVAPTAARKPPPNLNLGAYSAHKPSAVAKAATMPSTTNNNGVLAAFRRTSSTSSVTEEVIRYVAPDTILPSDMSMIERLKEAGSSSEICAICLDELGSGDLLRVTICKHSFHKECLLPWLRNKRQCPTCKAFVDEPVGFCPSGEMRISVNLGISCEGHTNDATIKIDYNIFSGKQKEYHETEGKAFQGTTRSAYLPDNDDGRRLLKRLKYAFSHGLIFRIGTSSTTGRKDVIIWAGIHHKTSYKKGAHGWPDSTFFVRCNKELDDQGVPKGRDCP